MALARGRPKKERRRIVQSKYPTIVYTRTRKNAKRFGKRSQQRGQAILVTRAIWAAQSKCGVEVREFRLESDGYAMEVFTPKANLSQFMQLVNSRIARDLNRQQKDYGNVWHERYHSTVVEPGEPEESALAELYEGLGEVSLLGCAFDCESQTARFYAFGCLVHVSLKGERWTVRWEPLEAESRRRERERKQRKRRKKNKGGSLQPYTGRIWDLTLVHGLMKKRVHGSPAFVARILGRHGPVEAGSASEEGDVLEEEAIEHTEETAVSGES